MTVSVPGVKLEMRLRAVTEIFSLRLHTYSFLLYTNFQADITREFLQSS